MIRGFYGSTATTIEKQYSRSQVILYPMPTTSLFCIDELIHQELGEIIKAQYRIGIWVAI